MRARVHRGLPLSILLLAPVLHAQGPGSVLYTEKIVLGSSGDQFGRSVALIGDLDDDGDPDLVVGASHSDDGNEDAGSVWIVFMRADRTYRAAQKISSTKGNLGYTLGFDDEFGKSVTGIGDFDGDGIEDIAVGAARGEDVYVLMLNKNGTVKTSKKISNNSGDFGYSVVPIGDFDKNGVTDLAIGDGKGDVFLYKMKSDGTSLSNVKMSGISKNSGGSYSSFLGVGMGSMGDLDGDGLIDLAIGDTAYDGGFNDSGVVHIVRVKSDGSVKSDVKLYDGAANLDLDLPDYPNFGRDIALIDDLDGNGVRDIAVGCSEDWALTEPEDSGSVYVIFLKSDDTALGYQKISRLSGNLNLPLTEYDEFGVSVANVGDWNADGVADLAVGARFDDNGIGALYLLMLNDGNGTPVDASFGVNPPIGIAPASVQFTDKSDGQVALWSWDFGDGSTSSQQNPAHVYAAPGTYTVALTVTHVSGRSDTEVVEGAVLIAPPGLDYFRLGCGTNPGGSLTVIAGVPQVGTTFTLGVDNPLGTQPAGSGTAVAFSFAPDVRYPCGTLVNGLGMAGPGAPGELLISLAGGNLARIVFGTPYGGPGVPGQCSLTVPNNPGLVGRKLYAQGFVIDSSGVSGIARGLTDGFEITLR